MTCAVRGCGPAKAALRPTEDGGAHASTTRFAYGLPVSSAESVPTTVGFTEKDA